MPIITVVIFQGSAGNGKTTCLLRSGLSRAKDEQKVVFIAATRIFADSVEQDLKGSLTTDFRIMVRDNFKNLIRTAFRIELSENELGHTDTTLEEVVKWLDDVESRRGKKTDLGAKRAISDWLMKGHRIAADTANYTLYIDIYKAWKKENKKRDEGDLWNDVIPMLSAENAAGENTESVVNADLIGGATSRLSNLVRECDSLVIDEAQLYPAETYFTALMLWYRPRKALLLGMDSKQAVYLGCSNRKALLRAVDAAGWHDRMVRYYTLTTNFRLPARLVALSNAMVKTLRKLFPKVFDEYQMDEGFEVRSSSADTLVAAESTDAPVRAIERFPAMLVIGEAAVELRKQVILFSSFSDSCCI